MELSNEAKILCEIRELLRQPSTLIGHGISDNYTIETLSAKITFENGLAKLPANQYRQGFIAVNKTDDLVYGLAGTDTVSANNFTWQISSEGTEYYIPANGAYLGEVNFKAVGTGYLMVTEFSFKEI
jgi:hypothetical protein